MLKTQAVQQAERHPAPSRDAVSGIHHADNAESRQVFPESHKVRSGVAAKAMRWCFAIVAGTVLSGIVPAVATAPSMTFVPAREFDRDRLPAIALAIAHSVPGFAERTIQGRLFSLPGEADTDVDADGQPKAAGIMQPDPDEKLRFGSLGIPRKMVMTMLRAAEQAEVDPVYLMALADKESSFRPEVKASTSSAQGLFQFIESTWLEIVHDYGSRHGLAWEASLIDTSGEKPMVKSPSDRERILDLRRDPYIAAVMASELMKRDRAQVAFRIGRDLKPAELYLTHFLGPQDAATLLELQRSKPEKAASKEFPSAARANKSIFFASKGRRLKPLSVGEVYGRIEDMIAVRLERYTSVGSFSAPVYASAADVRTDD
ncbi:transglycosylase SLT domain-containing protein [Alsobacter sp. KACC 23698]|uniref:Transglycosylase SLT domain-containing protein n=1 Tax=Alsobacter sp. KACC 23698 TaxID=3149229 RepID=A0AAU7JMA0_9HYPH